MTHIREPQHGRTLVADRPLPGGAGGRAAEAVFGMADVLRGFAPETPGGGLADAVTSLFTGGLRFDAADPQWPDRDRVLVPAGSRAEALLAAVLELTGHAGMAPGGADALDDHPAVEAVPGAAGQALAVGVGVALTERMLAARFGRSLVDHRTWVLLSPNDLAGGLSHEAAALAGHLGLGRLTVLWEDDGFAASCSAASETKRFAAAGWTTRRVDGRDAEELSAALALAVRSRRPTLIACETGIVGDAGEAGEATALPRVQASAAVDQAWAAAGGRGGVARRGWKKRATRHALGAEFDRVTAGRMPDGWTGALRSETAAPRADAGSPLEAGLRAIAALSAAVPELAGAAMAELPGLGAVGPERFAARVVELPGRAQMVAACVAGMALHGGVVPFAHAALADSDALRPTLRFLAWARQRAVFVLHDDGTQPEQAAALRTVPGLHVHRPADATETVECWELALRRTDGPSVLLVSGDDTAAGSRADSAENRCARGAYVRAEADGPRRATLIAGGTEVPVALAARDELAASGVAVAVVSLPCRELFAPTPPGEAAPVLGDVLRAAVAGGDALGLRRWLGPDDLLLAGPADEITAGAIAQAVRKRLSVEEE